MNIKVPNEAENFLTKLNGYLYMWREIIIGLSDTSVSARTVT